MPVCKKIRLQHRLLCSGDLDRKIEIKTRELNASSSSVDFSETFVVLKNVWAGLKTAKGREMFYASNMQDAVTHVFYFRWFAGLETQHWIEYKSENYDILDIDNLDERDEWYACYCNVRGSESLEVNHV